MFGSGLWLGVGFGNPTSPGWGLGRVCLGTVCGVVPLLPAGVCGVCGWAWVSACTPPFVVWDMGRARLCARSACTPPFPGPACGVGVRAGVWVSSGPRHSLGKCSSVCVLVCPPRVVSCTSWFGMLCWGVWFVPRPATPGWHVRVCVCLCARPACSPPFLAGVCCGDVRDGPGSRLCRALLGWVVRLCFFFGGACHASALWCRSLAVPVPGFLVPVSPSSLFRAGLLALFFFFSRGVCLRALGVPSLSGPLLLAWCCRFWPGGPPVPLLGGFVFSALLIGRFAASCGVGGRFGGFWPFSRSSAPLFFFEGGSACSSLCLPWAGARTGLQSVWSSGLLLVVAFCLAPSRPHGFGWAGLGSALLPAGLGPGSAGWAAAPGGFVWLRVRGAGVVCVLSPLRCWL